MRYVGVPIMEEEYLPLSGQASPDEERRQELEHLVTNSDRITMLQALAELSAATENRDHLALVFGGFRQYLATVDPTAVGRLDAAMSDHGGRRAFLNRQQLLRAMREVLCRPEPSAPHGELPQRMAMIRLAHVVAGIENAETPTTGGESTIAGFPEQMAIDIVRSQAFHDNDDVVFAIDRYLRLWRDYGPKAAWRLGDRKPTALLQSITGFEIEDILAAVLAFNLHFENWKPGQSFRLRADLSSGMPAATREAILQMVSTTVDELATAYASGPTSKWDFLPIQRRPVIRDGDSLIVLDGRLVFERFSDGAYWLVHDHLKATEEEKVRKAWEQAWGDMVEDLARDDLRQHAPRDLTGKKTFFRDTDIKAAYGTDVKNADVLIDMGAGIAVVEVVSGRLSTGTRITGKRSSFNDDMKKCLYKKICQLHGTIEALVDNPTALLPGGLQGRPIQPVVVAGETFPVSPVTCRCAVEFCQTHGLLGQDGVRPLAIIDVGDLESLEGLAHQGHSILSLLDGWKRSDLAEASLRNYLLEQHPWNPDHYRHPRVRPRVYAAFTEIRTRLKLSPGDEPPDPAAGEPS